MHAYRLMIRDVMVYAVSNGKTRFLSLSLSFSPILGSWPVGDHDSIDHECICICIGQLPAYVSLGTSPWDGIRYTNVMLCEREMDMGYKYDK